MRRGTVTIFNLLLLSMLYLSAGSVLARETGFSAPMDLLGLGLEGQQQLADILNLRTKKVHFSYSDSLPENIFFAQQEKNLHNSTVADYHPWTGGFRISAGVFYNNRLNLAGEAPSSVGTSLPCSTAVEQQQYIAPYLGLGWGAAPNSKSNWALTLDIGFLYQKQDESSAQCFQGPTSRQCGSPSGLQPDAESLLESVQRHGIYPVLSAGITFKF